MYIVLHYDDSSYSTAAARTSTIHTYYTLGPGYYTVVSTTSSTRLLPVIVPVPVRLEWYRTSVRYLLVEVHSGSTYLYPTVV